MNHKALWSNLFSNEDLIGSYQKTVGNYFLNEKNVPLNLKKKAHSIFGHYLRFSLSNRVVDKYPELISSAFY
jgi:hypothetical protein